MRSIVFTNANGVSITLGSTPILIDSITGLGGAPVSVQYQKAPYQDGSTYIDALMENRIITVDCTLSAAATLTAQYTQRATILNVLNPKLGKGTLVYTYAGGTKTFFAIPIQPIFPNKHATEPRQKFQISFECCDPFAYGDEVTVTLPTPTIGSTVTINGAASGLQSIVKTSGGDIVMVYIRNSDSYLCRRTYSSGTWGAENVVNAFACTYPGIIETVSGNFVVCYRKTSDTFVYHDRYTSLWASLYSKAQTAFDADYCSLSKLPDNGYILYYRKISDGYVYYSRKDTGGNNIWVYNTTFQAFCPIAITSQDYLITKMAFIKTSDNKVYYSTINSFGTILDETKIYDTSSYYVNMSKKSDGTIVVSSNTTTSNLSYFHIIKSDGTILTESAIGAIGEFNFYFVTDYQKNIIYRRLSDSYIVSKTKGPTQTLATNAGDQATPCTITFNGPSTNPRIVKQSTLEQIRLNTTLATGDTFTVSTAFGQKTVLLTSGGISVNGMQYLDLSSTFFQLDTGDNVVYYEDDAATSTATASLKFRSRYMGV